MLKVLHVLVFAVISVIACVHCWDSFQCNLKTGEGCNSSENGIFTVMYKGYRNDSGDTNKECDHFLRLKVKLPYNPDFQWEGFHITTLSCDLDLEDHAGPTITLSEDSDTAEATCDSPYFLGKNGYYSVRSRKNPNEFTQTIYGYGWQSLSLLIENGLFEWGYQQRTALTSTAIFTPEHPNKELYIGINIQYAQIETEKNGVDVFSDKIGGGACKISCSTWDTNASK